MPIIRQAHTFDQNFTRIPNAWLRDKNLSLKAKGLLAQIMSHTPGWTLSIASLAETNGCGKDTIRGAINELEQNGYLTREQDRNENGKFGDFVWLTHEPAGLPVPDLPVPENWYGKKTKIKEEQIKETCSTEVERAFEEFWNLYPRRVAKLGAKKAFEKAFKTYGQEVIDGAQRLADDPNLPEKRFIPHPATWLNGGGWTSEPYPERALTPEEREKRADELRRAANEAHRIARINDELKRQQEFANYVPATRCVHGKVLIICKKCSNFSGGKNGKN